MSTNGDGVTIPTRVDASGVAQGVQQTADGLAKIETATKSAAAAAQQAGATTAAASAQQAAGAAQAGAAATQAGAATANLGTLSLKTAQILAQLGITEASVAASALKVGSSLEVTGRALILIAQSRASDELARVREQLEAVGRSATDAAEQQQKGQEDAASSSGDLTYALETQETQLEDNTEKGSKFIEEMGGMRGSRRTALELFEVLQGGGDTISGLTGLMREFILTSSAIEGPIGLAFAGIALSLTGLIARHEDHAKAIKDDADATGKLKDAADSYIKAYTDSLDKIAQKQAAQLKVEQQITAEIASRGDLLKAQIALDERASELKLQQQYILDSSTTTDPAKLAELKRRFEAQKGDLKGDSTALTADEESAEADLKAEAERKALQTLQEQHRQNVQAAAAAYVAEDAAKRTLNEQGAFFDPSSQSAQSQPLDQYGAPEGRSGRYRRRTKKTNSGGLPECLQLSQSGQGTGRASLRR